jgi:hypothetical protein
MFPRRGPGLIRGVARTAAVAGTASAVSGRVQHRQQKKWAGQEAEQAAQQQPAAYEQPAQDIDAQVEQLTKLGQLRDQGILTPEEFEAKKKQILGL